MLNDVPSGAGHGTVFDRTLTDIRNPNCTDAKMQSEREPRRSNALALARIKPKWKHEVAFSHWRRLRETHKSRRARSALCHKQTEYALMNSIEMQSLAAICSIKLLGKYGLDRGAIH